MDERDAGILLDQACYSIVTENNAVQYYPDYAYCHPLFAPDMKIHSDSVVSGLFHKLKPEQMAGFLDKWNASRNKRQRIYISYDFTDKNSQAGDINLVEYGRPKLDEGQPVFNYSVTYDV